MDNEGGGGSLGDRGVSPQREPRGLRAGTVWSGSSWVAWVAWVAWMAWVAWLAWMAWVAWLGRPIVGDSRRPAGNAIARRPKAWGLEDWRAGGLGALESIETGRARLGRISDHRRAGRTPRGRGVGKGVRP